MRSAAATISYLAILVVLVALSPPRITGDGPEYLLLAQRFARADSPNIPIGVAQEQGLYEPRLIDRYAVQQLWHFWFFPLLVSPLFWVTGDILRFGPFVLANMALLTITFGVVWRRLGTAAAAFVGLGPIIWWVDKAQTEVFTVAALSVGFALLARPAAAALAFAVASTQNPPIGVLALLLFGVSLFRGVRNTRIDYGLWCAAAAMTMLHPLFYLWRLGRLTPLVEGQDLRIPALRTMLAVVNDLNIGIAINAPITLSILVATLLVSALRRGAERKRLAFIAAATTVFLVAFAQAPNVNSGGTPGMSRYALWLAPVVLAVWPTPGLRTPAGQIRSAAVALAVVWDLCYFRPSLPERYLTPTATALAVWTTHPSWENPLPEIFAERIRQKDGANLLAATPNCAKALLQDGQWPTPCPSIPIPAACRHEGALCYANRRPDGTYHFVKTSRRGGYRLR
jgi:hypothetical protein